MTKTKQHKDYHLYNIMAYKNRVSGNEHSDEGPTADVKELPLTEYLPNDQDNKHYIEEFTHLIAWVWVKHVPALSWWEEHMPTHIPHDHEEEMKKKTERVSIHINFEKEKYYAQQK